MSQGFMGEKKMLVLTPADSRAMGYQECKAQEKNKIQGQ